MKNAYHYTECGLDIYLLNGFSIDEDDNLHIKNIHGLHRVIAEMLVTSPEKLRGKEVRFLRQYLDCTQKRFGEMLGVDYQSVLRWEAGKNRITKSAELLLRGIVYEYINENGRVVDLIKRLSDIDHGREDPRKEFTHKGDNWKRAA